MLFDCHLHSAASPDSDMPPEDAIETLAKKGLGCIFTEHIDYNTDLEPFFALDFDIFPKEYIKYKSDTVGIGIEINLITEAVELNRGHAADESLDFVLGAIHWTEGWDVAFAEDYYKEYDEEVYERYLNYSLKMVEMNDFFDSLAHIDYVSRYSPLPEKNVLYEKYSTSYDALLKALIERDKLLELNTRRLADKQARNNLAKVYSRYRDLGGKYVTLGSDAHHVSKLGENFDIAVEMIKEIGLLPVYFKERRRVVCTPI